MSFIEKFTGSFADKRRWRAVKRRIATLPSPYLDAVEALMRYERYAGGIIDGPTMITMHEDLVDLFDRAAADGTPIRSIVGDDPVEFAETFIKAYAGKHWIDKEQRRLTQAIDQAESQQQRSA